VSGTDLSAKNIQLLTLSAHWQAPMSVSALGTLPAVLHTIDLSRVELLMLSVGGNGSVSE